MSNECKLPAVLDRLSSGPGKGPTGWSARTLLGLRWSDPGRDVRATAACGARRTDVTATSAGSGCAPAFANATAAGNSTAAASNAACAVAIGRDSVFPRPATTAAGAATHANTGGRCSCHFSLAA